MPKSIDYKLGGIVTDLKGEPLMTGEAINSEGSAFFNPEWKQGNIKLANGKQYIGLSIKLNLVNDQIHYLIDEKKSERVAALGIVKEVQLEDPETNLPSLFRCGFPSVSKHDERTFYMILTEGSVTLLKQVKRILIEEKSFNSASIKYRYDTQKDYYLFKDGNMIRVKRTKPSILECMKDQKESLESYINSNSLNLKSDEDLVKLVNHYNLLSGK